MTNITSTGLFESSLMKAYGLDQYLEIMKLYHSDDYAIKKHDFQETFSSYFRLRRDDEWKSHFFRIADDYRQKNGYPLEILLTKVKEITGNYELSFCSKLLAIHQPNHPIVDSILLKFFDLKQPTVKNVNDLVILYIEYSKRFDVFMHSRAGQSLIALFDKVFPHLKSEISDVKKMDTIIWKHALGKAKYYEVIADAEE